MYYHIIIHHIFFCISSLNFPSYSVSSSCSPFSPSLLPQIPPYISFCINIRPEEECSSIGYNCTVLLYCALCRIHIPKGRNTFLSSSHTLLFISLRSPSCTFPNSQGRSHASSSTRTNQKMPHCTNKM